MRKILWAGLLGLALGFAPIAFAQEAETPVPNKPAAAPAKKPAQKKAAAKSGKPVKGTAQVFGSWTVTCGPNKGKTGNCSAQLQMIEPKKKLPLLTWFVGFGDKGTPLMEVITPSGVLISPGVKMEIGKVKSQSPYVNCAPLGCASRFIADKSVVNAMRSAKEAKFIIVTLTKQIANVTVKPTGTAEMLAAIGL